MYATVLHDPSLVEYADAKQQTWRADYKVIHGFSTALGQGGGLVPLTPHIVQGSTIVLNLSSVSPPTLFFFYKKSNLDYSRSFAFPYKV